MVDLLTKVDDINAVDEGFREAYTEKDGAFFLNAKTVGTLEVADTAALKKALNSEKQFKEDALKLAKPFEKFAEVDLDAAVEALGKVEELTKGSVDFQAELKGKLESQAEQLLTQHGETLTAEKAKSEKFMAQLRTLMVDNEAIRAIQAAEGNVENLLPHVRARVKLVELDDGFGIEVLTTQGEPAIDGEAKPIGIETLVNSFKEVFPFAFKGVDSKGGGGGAGNQTPGAGGVKTITRADYDKLDPFAQRAFNKDKDGNPTGNKIVD